MFALAPVLTARCMFGDCFRLLPVVWSHFLMSLFFVCQIHVSGGYAVISFWQVSKMWPSFLCCWVYKLSSDVVAECWWKAVLLLLYSLVFMLRCCLLLVAYNICRSARCMCSVSTRGIGCLSGNGLWTGARATLASRIEASCYSNYRGTLETCWARQEKWQERGMVRYNQQNALRSAWFTGQLGP